MKFILDFFWGYASAGLSGSAAERFLTICKNNRIILWKIQKKEEMIYIQFRISALPQCQRIANKTGVELKILQERGLPHIYTMLKKKQWFFAGFLLTCFLLWFSTLFIWKIKIENNYHITDETIEQYLAKCNIHKGTRLSKVHCKKLGEQLRIEFDDFIWTSVSLNGTTITIRVKERIPTSKTKYTHKLVTPYDLIANYDGIVMSIVTKKGIPKVKAGKSVKKGTPIVSGNIPIKNDNGTCTDYQYVKADATVYIKHTIEYYKKIAKKHREPAYQKFLWIKLMVCGKKKNFSIGYIPKSMKTFKVSVYYYNFYICPVLNLQMNIRFLVVQKGRYQIKFYSKRSLESQLLSDFRIYCNDLKKKGVQISTNSVKIYTDSDYATARGTITVIEEGVKLVPVKAKHAKGTTK